MSADTLLQRTTTDIQERIEVSAAVLVESREAPLDMLRYHQGMIAGLKMAVELLTDRARNLYAHG